MLLDLIGAIALGIGSAIAVGALALNLGATLSQKLRIAAVLTAWLGLVIVLGATGALHSELTDPLGIRAGATARLGMAVVLPIAAISAAVLFIRSLKERVIGMPVASLVGINIIRVLGVLFVILYSAGRLPAPFAPAAGWGDVFIGVTAIPLALAARSHENRALLLGWNALGLFDLINAVGLGVSAALNSVPGTVDTGPMTLLPWLLIPGFLVPLLAATHLAIFYKLLRRGAASSRRAFA